jgi:hypothetical protein
MGTGKAERPAAEKLRRPQNLIRAMPPKEGRLAGRFYFHNWSGPFGAIRSHLSATAKHGLGVFNALIMPTGDGPGCPAAASNIVTAPPSGLTWLRWPRERGPPGRRAA